MMRHRRLWAVLLGLLAGPLHAENAAPVDVERLPARAPAATLDLTGSVSTARVSRLSPDVAGRVEQVHHDAGDSVSAGTPLMTLDAQLAVLAGQRTAAAVREAEIGAREASRLVAEADRLVERGNLPASQLEVRRAAQAQAEAAAARLRAEALAMVDSLDEDVVEDAAADVPWVTIVWDDPVNLMTYVTYVFQKLFGYSEPHATKLMMQVHQEGRAVVSAGTRESMEADVSKLHAAGLWATLQQDR